MGVAPPTATPSSKNVIFNNLPPHTSPLYFALFPSQKTPLSSPTTIVMRSLFLRHTRSLPSSFLTMSHCCSAISAASNSAAVATVDSEYSSSSSSAPSKSKPRLRGVVFDMDGTLTVPVIDFQAMYKAVLGDELYADVRSKNPSGIDILNLIDGWSPDRQQKAYQVIEKFEKDGIDRLRIMPGAYELCQFLDSKKIRRGLITRNVKDAVDVFHKQFDSTFSPALSREFRPYKPDPAPLLHICSVWEIDPREVMMIGDSLKDDVACGKRAGAHTCLLDETGRYDSPEYSSAEHKPDFKVSSLDQALSLLESHFELAP